VGGIVRWAVIAGSVALFVVRIAEGKHGTTHAGFIAFASLAVAFKAGAMRHMSIERDIQTARASVAGPTSGIRGGGSPSTLCRRALWRVAT
jgi:hypothetical protein